MPRTATGLDLGHHSVKAWELRKKFGQPWELTGFHEESLPEPLRTPLAEGEEPGADRAQKAAFLRRFLETRGMLGQNVLVALPADRVATHVLHLPKANLKVLRQLVPAELEDRLPFPLEEAIVDFRLLRKDEEGTTVLAAAAHRDVVADLLEFLQQAGIQPPLLGLESVAIANMEPLVAKAWAGQRIGLLDIGSAKSILSFFVDGRLERVRVLRAGGGDIDAEASVLMGRPAMQMEMLKETRGRVIEPGESEDLDTLKLSEAILNVLNPLTAELVRTLRVAEMEWKAPLDGLFLMGGTSNLSGIDAYFAHRLDRPVRRFNVLEIIPNRLNGHSPVPNLSPVGLGVALQGGGGALLDFRKGEFALPSVVEGVGRRLTALAALVFAMLALWGILGVFQMRMLDRRIEALRGDLAAIYADTMGESAPPGKELELLRQRVSALAGAGTAMAGQGLSALDVLDKLTRPIGTGVTIDVDRLEITDHGEAKVRARTNSFESVSVIEKAWKEVAEFKKVTTGKVQTGADGVQFNADIGF